VATDKKAATTGAMNDGSGVNGCDLSAIREERHSEVRQLTDPAARKQLRTIVPDGAVGSYSPPVK